MKTSKILFLSLLTIAISKTSSAQNWPADGSYTVNNTMIPFHGTWQWASGTDTVKLYLMTKKVYYPINGGFYIDNLVGWHLYKKGNITIESSFSYIGDQSHRTFLGSNTGSVNPYKIEDGGFKDLTKNKDAQLTLTLNSAQTQLTWRSTESQRIYGKGHAAISPGLTLPRNMVLTKL